VSSTEPAAPARVLPGNLVVWGKYAAGMALVLGCMLLSMGSPYWLNIVTYTCLMGGLAGAWNIIGGFGGQFSLGHGVFFGIGAYTTVLLYTGMGLSPWLGMLVGAVLAAAVSLPVSWPTFRLRGPFFAIATMALNQIAFVLVNYADDWTGGPRGILVPFRAGWSNMIFIERWKYGLLMFAFMALVTAVAIAVRRSRLGYHLLAVRENEDAARAGAVDVLGVKLQGMALSAALTAIGGALFAMYLRFVDPNTVFTLAEVGVKFALLTLIGGVGTIAGPILGAILVVPMENYLRGTLGGALAGAHHIIMGALMIAFALFMKRGLVGAATDLLARWQRRRRA
jgi:branched-chain amino acid transport system permease protein